MNSNIYAFVVIIATLGAIECNSEIYKNYRKCCDSDSIYKKVNQTYICSPNSDLRLQIIQHDSDVINKSETNNKCIEIEDGIINLYNRSEDGDLISKEVSDLKLDYFSKCCPLGYFYNTTTHACVKSSKTLHKFYVENIVRIGLPHCKIIADFELRSYKAPLKNKLEYCVDLNEIEVLTIRVCKSNYDICKSMKCIHKCCPDGQSFINGSHCVDTFVNGLDLSLLKGQINNASDKFATIHGHNPPVYIIKPPRFNFQIDSYGSFIVREFDPELKLNVTNFYPVEEEVYCIEHARKTTKFGVINGLLFFRGFPVDKVSDKYLYTRVAMAISSVFLVITLVYYLCSKEKRTVFGKTLISYCFACLVNFGVLCFLAHNVRPQMEVCSVLAFVVVYYLLASFTWMNIMCIDIYWTFGSPKSFSSLQHRSKELKRFMLYSLYGWGLPFVLTAIPLIFYHLQVLPDFIAVVVDVKKCLFRTNRNYASYIFIWLWISILEICNVVLFVKTISHCLKVKRQITKMNDTPILKGEKNQKFENFKTRFGLLIKLFLIMGVSYVFEVVSIFFDFKRNDMTALVELIWDTFNSLQGLFIFLIFVFKKRILLRCNEKFGIHRFRKCSLNSSTNTQVTTIAPHK